MTPSEVVKVISVIGHDKLMVVYPEVEFDIDQQKKLIKFLLTTGEVRQAIKIDTPIHVAIGHIECTHPIGEELIKYLSVGYYLTESKLTEGTGTHTYLTGLDGEKYTVISDRLQTHHCPDTGAFFSARKVDKLRLKQSCFHEILLYREDVEGYAAKLCNKGRSLCWEQPVKDPNQVNRKLTIADLKDATGASCEGDAYEVAMWHIEQTEEHNEYLDKSPELRVLYKIVRKYRKGEFRFKNRTHLEAHLNKEYSFTTRQANVFAEQIIKIVGK